MIVSLSHCCMALTTAFCRTSNVDNMQRGLLGIRFLPMICAYREIMFTGTSRPVPSSFQLFPMYSRTIMTRLVRNLSSARRS